MTQNGCRLGGEQSGHIIFSNMHLPAMASFTSLKIMEAMMASKKKLSQLTEGLTIYPQVLENVRVKDKAKAQADPEVQAAVGCCGPGTGDSGRILVRESGTEPLIRVMVEQRRKNCAISMGSGGSCGESQRRKPQKTEPEKQQSSGKGSRHKMRPYHCFLVFRGNALGFPEDPGKIMASFMPHSCPIFSMD